MCLQTAEEQKELGAYISKLRRKRTPKEKTNKQLPLDSNQFKEKRYTKRKTN